MWSWQTYLLASASLDKFWYNFIIQENWSLFRYFYRIRSNMRCCQYYAVFQDSLRFSENKNLGWHVKSVLEFLYYSTWLSCCIWRRCKSIWNEYHVWNVWPNKMQNQEPCLFLSTMLYIPVTHFPGYTTVAKSSVEISLSAIHFHTSLDRSRLLGTEGKFVIYWGSQGAIWDHKGKEERVKPHGREGVKRKTTT